MDTLAEKPSNCCDYFFRLSGFPDIFDKVFLITFKFSSLDHSTMFCKSKGNKTVYFLLVSLTYREITTVKNIRNFMFSLKVLKTRKRSWYYICFIMAIKKYGWAIQFGNVLRTARIFSFI